MVAKSVGVSTPFIGLGVRVLLRRSASSALVSIVVLRRPGDRSSVRSTGRARESQAPCQGRRLRRIAGARGFLARGGPARGEARARRGRDLVAPRDGVSPEAPRRAGYVAGHARIATARDAVAAEAPWSSRTSSRSVGSTRRSPSAPSSRAPPPRRGSEFYRALVRNLARALDTHGAWLTEYDEPTGTAARARVLVRRSSGSRTSSTRSPGTPCETAIRERRVVHIPDRVVELYPDDQVKFPAPRGRQLPRRPAARRRRARARPPGGGGRPADAGREAPPRRSSRSSRTARPPSCVASALEEELREREEKLTGLIGSAMDAIVELDDELRDHA